MNHGLQRDEMIILGPFQQNYSVLCYPILTRLCRWPSLT